MSLLAGILAGLEREIKIHIGKWPLIPIVEGGNITETIPAGLVKIAKRNSAIRVSERSSMESRNLNIVQTLCLSLLAAAAQICADPLKVTLEPVKTDKEVVIPKWQNGYFVSFDVPNGGSKPNIYVHDRIGKLVAAVAVDVPESIDTGIADVAISSDREIAVALGARSADGREGAFLEFIDKNGRVRLLLRTTPFTIRRIAFGYNGNLWAFGWQLDSNGMEVAQYDILREYNPAGVMLRSALPRADFSTQRGPSLVANSFFALSDDYIGFYSGKTSELLWLSSNDGGFVRRSLLQVDGVVRRIAIARSGDVWTSLNKSDGSVFVVRFSSKIGEWSEVAGLHRSVIGVDGDYVVASDGSSTFSWVKVSELSASP
jgi:hypothetical protein